MFEVDPAARWHKQGLGVALFHQAAKDLDSDVSNKTFRIGGS